MDRVKKFGKFRLDAKTGAGTLEVVAKRLMGEDIDVIIEVLKRYTEVQHIRLQKCFLSDDTLQKLYDNGLHLLRHLKSLYMPFNMLTERSVNLVIEKFSKLGRQLQNLDFRSNSINEDSAEELYNAFPSLHSLNEIQIYKSKSDLTNSTIDCKGLFMKLPEMKIIVCMLKSMGRAVSHLRSLDLSNNLISAKGLKLLAEGIRKIPIRELDISYNPCTDDDLDFSGIEELYLSVHREKYISNLYYEGVNFPEELVDSLYLSMQVNRSLLPPEKNPEDGLIKDKFASYIYDVVQETTESLPENIYKDMEFEFKVDKTFCRLNRIPKIEVDMHKDSKGFDIVQKKDDRAKIHTEY